MTAISVNCDYCNPFQPVRGKKSQHLVVCSVVPAQGLISLAFRKGFFRQLPLLPRSIRAMNCFEVPMTRPSGGAGGLRRPVEWLGCGLKTELREH